MSSDSSHQPLRISVLVNKKKVKLENVTIDQSFKEIVKQTCLRLENVDGSLSCVDHSQLIYRGKKMVLTDSIQSKIKQQKTSRLTFKLIIPAEYFVKKEIEKNEKSKEQNKSIKNDESSILQQSVPFIQLNENVWKCKTLRDARKCLRTTPDLLSNKDISIAFLR